jgi:hypothetical protein
MKGIKSMSQEKMLARLNCGPVKFSGGNDALYERHLTFDHVVPLNKVTSRDRFEAVAHSVRDVLSQRWLKTEQTYHERNAKRVYYLSLEFLMGRALANNFANLMLDEAGHPVAFVGAFAHRQPSDSRCISVPMMAISMPNSAMCIPRLAVSGWLKPFNPRMKRIDASR